MQHQAGRITWRDALGLFAAVLILHVTVDVVLLYRSYFPPDFRADFLLGRRRYFWGPYSWAFYVHIISGPLSLILGILLLSNRFRTVVPDWHRRLGKIQVANVLLFVVPSGLWMARYAITGAIAGIGLASMGVATAISCARGWRLAVRKQFAQHQRWMWRTYVLLCGAVVIRLIGGVATWMHVDALWVYPAASWLSWLVPLLVFEWAQRWPVASMHATPVRMNRDRCLRRHGR